MNRYDDIRRWASDRNLIDGSNPKAQFLKLAEEMGELGHGLGKHDVGEVRDAIGDMIVVLTIMSAQMDMAVEDCIEEAWYQIKDRKGYMSNGIFVKEV